MAEAKQYKVNLQGISPLLFHRDNLSYTESLVAWRKDPDNKSVSQAGDDRSPAWTWIGSLYFDPTTRLLGIDSDNLMTMLREAGAKLPTGVRSATFKKETQYGMNVDQIQWNLVVGGRTISMDTFQDLIGDNNFPKHLQRVQENGFDLFVKRARVGQSKHIRVRPRFDNWAASGSITVYDEEASGLTEKVIQRIFDIAGAYVGLCDWRPSSRTPGAYGRFTAEVKPM